MLGRDSKRSVRKKAARWAMRLTEPELLSAAEHAELTEFLAEHGNSEEFLATRKDLEATADLPVPCREVLTASVRRHEDGAPSRRRIRWSIIAAAASVLLVIGVYFTYAWQRPDVFTTGPGQMRKFTLKD